MFTCVSALRYCRNRNANLNVQAGSSKTQRSRKSWKWFSEFSHVWVFDFVFYPKSKTRIQKTRKKFSEISENPGVSEFSTWPIQTTCFITKEVGIYGIIWKLSKTKYFSCNHPVIVNTNENRSNRGNVVCNKTCDDEIFLKIQQWNTFWLLKKNLFWIFSLDSNLGSSFIQYNAYY